MSEGKQCSACMSKFPAGHWAATRDKCPACGGAMESLDAGVVSDLQYEHYDSSADIRFDLKDLLTIDQRREMRLVLWLGFALILLACGARFGFIAFGGYQGFWNVPIWFDIIVAAMLLLASLMVVWSWRRLVRHRRAMRRAG